MNDSSTPTVEVGRVRSLLGGSDSRRARVAVRTRRWVGRRIPITVAVTAALIAMAVYSTTSAFQWHRMDTPSWDLAIFTQLAKAYAAGQPPIVDIKGHGFNLLGDHFHPILVLLAPVYLAWPSGLSIMLVQDALLAASVGIFGWFGARKLGAFRGSCLALGFGLSFGVLEAVRVQFHEVAFAIPLMSLSLCLLACGRLRAATLWAVPLVFVKEDMGVTAAMIGALIACRDVRAAGLHLGDAGRVGRFLTIGEGRRGPFLIVWGLAWSALAVFVIVPWFNPGGNFAYGGTIDVLGAIADPLQSLGLMFYPWAKSQTLGLVLVAGTLVCLRSPIVLVAVPTLVWRFLSDNPGYWEASWHYNLVVMPVLFAAILDASMKARPTRAGAFARGIERMSALAPTLAAGVALVLLPTSGLISVLLGAGAPPETSVAAEARAIDRIPAGSSVASDLTGLVYLVPDHDVQWIGTDGDPAPDYVLINARSNTWNTGNLGDPRGLAEKRYGVAYRPAFDSDGVVLLAKST
ncbi:DUF2079 domain-containing protein [Curtobacterium sp. S6]|uniref:DUF2079 domain-containing protein n=1 Tax=Curtobacterium sp. S6 TaxID=1479623 RepID=UPI00068C32A0|nr:DUF2079 domain-containing protein [Curtobacterium sp. S6]